MTAPQLPYELIRIIFGLAASESHHTALMLLLVSHEAHNWLEYQLYAAVRIRSNLERDRFKKCRIARNDDAFFANAVQKLHLSQDSTILSVCTNLTHLVLSQQHLYPNAPPSPPSQRHLENLKYLALLEVDDDYSFDALPPNITHVQFRSSNIKTDDYLLPQFTRDCPFLSHVMLDWVDFDDEEVFSRLPVVPTNLPSQCCCIAVTVPCALLLDCDRLKEMREMQRRYPQLLLINVDASKGVVMENVIQCDYSLVLRLEFWDEMKEALGRAQV